MKKSVKTVAAFIAATMLGFSVQAQVRTLTTVRPLAPAFQLGWDNTGTSGSLELRNDFNQPINFFTNNFLSGTIDPGGPVFLGCQAGSLNAGVGVYNTGIGYQALKNTTWSLSYQTAIGYQALYSYSLTTGYWATNVAVGHQALYSTQAYGGTAVGFAAGLDNTTGCSLTAIGEETCRWNTTGTDNVGVGAAACHMNTTGSANTCVGDHAGAADSYTTGMVMNNNSLFGNGAGNLIHDGNNQNSGFGDSVLYNVNASNNCAFGHMSLYTNTTGTPNSAFGYQTLLKNTTGKNNDAFGYLTLFSNVTGKWNAAFGDYALNANTGSNNSAFGVYALNYNTSGANNNAFGQGALYTNTAGAYNCAFGAGALEFSSAASGTGGNCAFGYSASYSLTTGTGNTSLGYQAGNVVTTGSNNTLLGNGANVNAAGATLSNQTSIGASAVNTHGVNTMLLGNAAVTGIWYGNAATTLTASDGRFKTNVTENVKGLAFINKLRPVTYNFDAKKFDDFLIQSMPDSAKAAHKAGMDFAPSMAMVHSGFIAQEVAQAAQTTGFTSSIVSVPANSSVENYGLAYAEFVVPLVKAVQELSHIVDSLRGVTSAGNRTIQNPANGGANPANATSISTINNIELASNSAIIYQNAPNPFGDGTMVKYFIPENATNAQIVFYDQFGSQLNTFAIAQTGAGQLNIASINLAPGTYSYSLMINGKVVDTKKMMKQ